MPRFIFIWCKLKALFVIEYFGKTLLQAGPSVCSNQQVMQHKLLSTVSQCCSCSTDGFKGQYILKNFWKDAEKGGCTKSVNGKRSLSYLEAHGFDPQTPKLCTYGCTRGNIKSIYYTEVWTVNTKRKTHWWIKNQILFCGWMTKWNLHFTNSKFYNFCLSCSDKNWRIQDLFFKLWIPVSKNTT